MLQTRGLLILYLENYYRCPDGSCPSPLANSNSHDCLNWRFWYSFRVTSSELRFFMRRYQTPKKIWEKNRPKVVFTAFESFILKQMYCRREIARCKSPHWCALFRTIILRGTSHGGLSSFSFSSKSEFAFETFLLFQMNTVWLYEWCEGTMLPLEWPRSAAGSTSLSKE